MKLKKNINIPAFLQAVQNCQGEVLFATSQGDQLNLKSQLAQFVFTAVIAGQLDALDGELCLQNETDFTLLQNYLLS